LEVLQTESTGDKEGAPPTATDDSESVMANNSVAISILDNDSDADGDLLASSVHIVTPPASGKLTSDPLTGVVTYAHDGSPGDRDEFVYTVGDEAGNTSNPATVTVQVIAAPNAKPLANNDAAAVDSGGTVTIQVLSNDRDSDGSLSPSTVQVLRAPAHGTTRIDSRSGAVSYTHNRSDSTSDSFTYSVADNDGDLSNVATVSITINPPPNTKPVAANDNATVAWDSPITITVLDNDNDADGTLSPGSVRITRAPKHGTAQVNTRTGTVTYTHNGRSGTSDSFTYIVADNDGGVSNAATVAISINPPPNTKPVAANDNATVSWGSSVTATVLANDSDADGTLVPGSVQVTRAPTHGAARVNSATGAVSYAHNGTSGTSDSFTYTVADNDGGVSNAATVAITIGAPPNIKPVAANDDASVLWSESVAVAVLSNDSDADGTLAPGSVRVNRAPTHGTTTVDTSNGAITYAHNGSTGTSDSISYTVADNRGGVSNSATVSIAIGAAPPPPGDLGQRTLLWDPSTGTVSGYRIYLGNSANGTLVMLSEVMANQPGFDAAEPAVTYDVSEDLGLSAGDTACFRVLAFNSYGSSAKSDAACTSI